LLDEKTRSQETADAWTGKTSRATLKTKGALFQTPFVSIQHNIQGSVDKTHIPIAYKIQWDIVRRWLFFVTTKFIPDGTKIAGLILSLLGSLFLLSD